MLQKSSNLAEIRQNSENPASLSCTYNVDLATCRPVSRLQLKSNFCASIQPKRTFQNVLLTYPRPLRQAEGKSHAFAQGEAVVAAAAAVVSPPPQPCIAKRPEKPTTKK